MHKFHYLHGRLQNLQLAVRCPFGLQIWPNVLHIQYNLFSNVTMGAFFIGFDVLVVEKEASVVSPFLLLQLKTTFIHSASTEINRTG